MTTVNVHFKLSDKDTGWKKLMDLAKRLERDRPYAKAGVMGRRKARTRTVSVIKTTVTQHKSGGVSTSSRTVKKQVPIATPGGKEALDNVTLAVIHEFGTKGVPERSFIRSAFDKNRPRYEEMSRRLVTAMYEGKVDEKSALGILGLSVATDIKLGITTGSGIAPADAPRTIARKAAKGSSTSGLGPRTLVDTGQLVGAVSWAVIQGESETAGGGAP
jgi:hypothetical protein